MFRVCFIIVSPLVVTYIRIDVVVCVMLLMQYMMKLYVQYKFVVAMSSGVRSLDVANHFQCIYIYVCVKRCSSSQAHRMHTISVDTILGLITATRLDPSHVVYRICIHSIQYTDVLDCLRQCVDTVSHRWLYVCSYTCVGVYWWMS